MDINNKLLRDHNAGRSIRDAMFYDPFYGLSNQDNYFHWNAFLETADPLALLAWQWEVKTYFGLTFP